MERLTSNLLEWTLLVTLALFCSYCGANSKTGLPNGNLNFLKVLGTFEPLYLFLWKDYVRSNETCKGYDCMKRTATCEHMRMKELDRIEYNHTVSMLRDQTWVNNSFMGKFILGHEPPDKMNVYNVTGGEIPNPYISSYCMTLLYNQPDTFNCSVILISKDPSGHCNHTKPEVLANSKCALYMRGTLEYRVYPPLACAISFNNCSTSRITYMPYSPRCAVDRKGSDDTKG
uniref:Lipocalin n=1 Tax=Rhipicephalus zambeziensis TaxID=60191 RepID=A0A224YCP9_9ACAR